MLGIGYCVTRMKAKGCWILMESQNLAQHQQAVADFTADNTITPSPTLLKAEVVNILISCILVLND